MDKHRLVLLTRQRQLALAQGGGGGPGLPRHGLEVAPAHLLDLWLLLLVVLPLPRLHSLCVPKPPFGHQGLGQTSAERVQRGGPPCVGPGQG